MRKCDDVGYPMLVNLPKSYDDTGEGGMAFFFVVKHKGLKNKRQTCIAGDIIWPKQDCQIYPKSLRDVPIDAGLLIGSTGKSLWNGEKYFTPTFDNLTGEGKRFYRDIKKLYGDITIVTLLDT